MPEEPIEQETEPGDFEFVPEVGPTPEAAPEPEPEPEPITPQDGAGRMEGLRAEIFRLQGLVQGLQQQRDPGQEPEPEPVEEINWEEKSTKDVALILGRTSMNMVKAMEERVAQQMGRTVADLEVKMSRAMHPDFEAYRDGAEGMVALSTQNPHWSVEQCYQYAKRLRGGAPAQAPSPAPRGNGDNPPQGGERRETKGPGARGQLSLERALAEAERELKSQGARFRSG
jgi:hypothetical protein